MTETLFFAAAIVTGLAGSGHCLLMCGGIASLGGMNQATEPVTVRRRWAGLLLFNSGRLISYAVAGVLVAALGSVFQLAAPVESMGQLARIITGGVFVLIGLQILLPGFRLRPLDRAGQRFWQLLRPLMKRLTLRQGLRDKFLLGSLWGWLPCGMVYSMLLAALASGDMARGGLIMLGFGLGTLPAMVGMGIVGQQIQRFARQAAGRKLMAALVLACGLWVMFGPMLMIPSPGHHH